MDHIQDIFRHGAEGYTPATMWFTSGNIHKPEMTYQIEGFNRQKIRDYFIHPSDNTQGDYLGEHFFDMIRHAASEARRLGMNYWIYDEYNWSSGVAGGQVLSEVPWARSTRLFRVPLTAAAGETLRYPLPDKATFNTQPLLFVADGQEVSVTLDGDTIVWTNSADTEKTLEIYLTKWITGKNAACKGSEVVPPDAEGYLDVLDPEAVQAFIDRTHERYKKHIGQGFGDYVKGVFTDEVVILFDMRRPEEMPLSVLPWTRHFPEKFQARNGYDILPKLHLLMSGADTRLSIDYWETISDLFMNAFCRMTYDWCTRNNLIYTGHIDAEECILSAVYKSGDPYEYYKYFTWPGIDTIYTYYRINDYTYNITAKLAASAAHFHNKERVLSETFTISGWDIQLRDMKRIFNRLALHGISFLQFMGSRYCFAPGADAGAMTNNWQNPLFKHYGAYSQYVSGLQYLVANTVYDAHTLLFYPMTTTRAALHAIPVPVYQGDTNYTIVGLANALLNLNIPFEIGYEQVIDQAEIQNGKFLFAGSEYHTVILPRTTHLKERTFRQLQLFARTGGKIVAVNGKPEKIIGDTVYDAPALENAVVYDCYEYEYEGEHAAPFDSYQKAPMAGFTAALQRALSDMPASVISIEPCNGIMSAVRRKEDRHYVLITNDNRVPTTVRGQILSSKPFRCLNTETGELRPMKIEDRRFEAALDPFECIVIEISSRIEQQTSALADDHPETIPFQNVSFRIDGPNVALPDMYLVRGQAAKDIIRARQVFNPRRVCDLASALTDEDMVPCREAPAGLPIKAKRDWFGWTPVDRKYPAPGETVVCLYDFTVDAVPRDLRLISDPTYGIAWYLNNEQLYQTAAQRVWHYANPVFDLSHVAVPGRNRLVAVFTLPDYPATFDLPCAMLQGDFRVFGDFVLTQKPALSQLTYWNDQGYACYTGDGLYAAEFKAPADGKVILEMETTDVAEVYVNGQFVGKRLWDPYRLDLSPFVAEGINRLEIRVTSTLSNFIYNRNLSGLKSISLRR